MGRIIIRSETYPGHEAQCARVQKGEYDDGDGSLLPVRRISSGVHDDTPECVQQLFTNVHCIHHDRAGGIVATSLQNDLWPSHRE
jgi:hypothetical protein